MTFGSLFAGIGGMDLGLERAGLTCEWQVEIDPYCRGILSEHWPHVRRHDDIRTFPPQPADWRVDVIAGGFPCQDVSLAGRGTGLDGEQSGLWFEFERIIRLLRPPFVIVENTPGLFVRGFDRVLGSLAALGFDADWSTLSACSLGATHTRERVFIVAYPAGSMGKKGLWLREYRTAQEISSRYALTAKVLQMESTHRDCGVPDGLSERVGWEFRALGNSIMPQVAEWIGCRLLNATALAGGHDDRDGFKPIRTWARPHASAGNIDSPNIDQR